MSKLLEGHTLYLHDGSKMPAEEVLGGQMTLVYFSAGWCPPCHAFTPKLKRFYIAACAAEKPLEVLFVSRDHTADALGEYYTEHHGEWPYLPFGSPAIGMLLEKYDIKTIPSLQLVKSDGTVIIKDARAEIVESQDKGEDPLVLFQRFNEAYNAKSTSAKKEASVDKPPAKEPAKESVKKEASVDKSPAKEPAEESVKKEASVDKSPTKQEVVKKPIEEQASQAKETPSKEAASPTKETTGVKASPAADSKKSAPETPGKDAKDTQGKKQGSSKSDSPTEKGTPTSDKGSA